MKPLRILIRHLPTRDDRERVYSDPDAECPLLPVDEPALDRLQTVIADGVLMRFNDTSSAGIDVGALYE